MVAGPGGVDTRLGGGENAAHRVRLLNGRLHLKEFAVDKNGFVFVHHPTKVRDFYDEDEVRRVYYPEMEALIKREAGAKRVVVFDHTLRTQDQSRRESMQIRDVVRRVHNDYTEFSAAPYSLFDQLDADHDGKLTPKELQRAGAKPREAQPQEQGEQEDRPRGGRRRATTPDCRRSSRTHTGPSPRRRSSSRPRRRTLPTQNTTRSTRAGSLTTMRTSGSSGSGRASSISSTSRTS